MNEKSWKNNDEMPGRGGDTSGRVGGSLDHVVPLPFIPGTGGL